MQSYRQYQQKKLNLALKELHREILDDPQIPIFVVSRECPSLFKLHNRDSGFRAAVSSSLTPFVNLHSKELDSYNYVQEIDRKFGDMQKVALLHEDVSTHTKSFDLTVKTVSAMDNLVNLSEPELGSCFSQFQYCWSVTFNEWSAALIERFSAAEFVIGVCVYEGQIPTDAYEIKDAIANQVGRENLQLIRLPLPVFPTGCEFRVLCFSGRGVVTPNVIHVLPGYGESEEDSKRQICDAAFYPGTRRCHSPETRYTSDQLIEDPRTGCKFCDACYETGAASFRR